MEENNNKYGLATAISMIVGISVGSGIFFKVDDILTYTQGDMLKSILILVLGALCVIFGSITLSQLARITTTSGGVIGYYEEFISPAWAGGFAWFQLFVYYPTIVSVVSWVAGSFTTTILQLESNLELEIIIGIFYLIFFYGVNYFSKRLGGYFQNIATFIKLIPLIGIGIIALFWNEPLPEIPVSQIVGITDGGKYGWLAALAPMAFSYDGWIVTTSISQEVKNPNRTMPIALAVGPIIVLIVYLFYLFGMVSIAGTDFILFAGDDSIYYIGNRLFGPMGATVTTLFILIAILGVVNGVTLGHIRIPKIMGEKNMLLRSRAFLEVNPKTLLSKNASIFALVISLFWMLVHYLTLKFQLLGQSDVSEIAIAFSYLVYMALYLKVLQLYRKGRLENFWLAGIFPVLASFGSLIIVFGSLLTNFQYVPLFMLFNAAVILLGFYVFKYNRRNNV